MKKIIVIVSMFFGQYVFGQKVNTDITIINVSSYFLEMFPEHNKRIPMIITHHHYDALGQLLLQIVESKYSILITQYRYDNNGNETLIAFSEWTSDSSGTYWESKVPTKDVRQFKEILKETKNLFIEYLKRNNKELITKPPEMWGFFFF